jgi:hypothetical protein
MASLSPCRERNTPRLRRRFVSLAKKPSTALSQEADVGVKWKTKRGCFSSHSRVFVRGIVVDYDMDRLFLRKSGIDEIEETNKLLMAMALHAPTDDLAVKHIERGKQRGRAMTLVVVGHRAGTSLPSWHYRWLA